VVGDSGSQASIIRDESGVTFQIRQSSQTPHLMLSFGENVRVTTQACRVIDGARRDLTSLFEDDAVIQLHDISRALPVQGLEGELLVAADSVESQKDEPTQFILEAKVQNLDFMQEVYQIGGIITRSTVDSLSIKENPLLAAMNSKSKEAGDHEISANPNRFAIYDLIESGNTLKVRAQGKLRSLQVGRGAMKSEFVPKYLSFIAHHPAVSVTMTWAGWFLTVVLPIFLKTKYGHKSDVK
jgi:hypothetical protein